MRAALQAVNRTGVPEPSPLFWDHFSARVHEAVAADGLPRRDWWPDLWWRSRLAMACAAGVCAIVVVAAVVSMRSGDVRITVTDPEASVASVAEDVPDAEPAALLDDPSLDLVADLAAGVDWDAAGESGLETHETAADEAVGQLTAGERRELQRLLKEELTHTGA